MLSSLSTTFMQSVQIASTQQTTLGSSASSRAWTCGHLKLLPASGSLNCNRQPTLRSDGVVCYITRRMPRQARLITRYRRYRYFDPIAMFRCLPKRIWVRNLSSLVLAYDLDGMKQAFTTITGSFATRACLTARLSLPDRLLEPVDAWACCLSLPERVLSLSVFVSGAVLSLPEQACRPAVRAMPELAECLRACPA
jgi:hypothetical protein